MGLLQFGGEVLDDISLLKGDNGLKEKGADFTIS